MNIALRESMTLGAFVVCTPIPRGPYIVRNPVAALVEAEDDDR